MFRPEFSPCGLAEIRFSPLPGRSIVLVKGNSMTTQAKYLRRDPAEIKPWAETCGQIRFLNASTSSLACVSLF